MPELIELPQDSTQLPAHILKARKALASSFSAFSAGISTGGFDVLSIKGKVFALIRDGERNVIPDPNDADEPARSLQVVMIAANPAVSRIFYERGYEDGSAEKPDCYSNDGVKPDSEAQHPQATSCAGCKHAEWGTGPNGKGTACRISKRLAVAPAGDVEKPMLLRVPTASLSNLREYAEGLERRGFPITGVVTRIRFDPDEATPRLMFKAVGFLPEESIEKVLKLVDDTEIKKILGTTPSAGAPTAADEYSDVPAKPAKVSEDEASEALGEAPEKAEPKKKAKPKDDLPGEPVIKDTPKKAKPEANDADDELASQVAGLMSEFDD